MASVREILARPVRFPPILSYLFVIPIALISYSASRGADGDSESFFLGNVVLTIYYCIYMVASHRKAVSIHSLVHLIFFPIASFIGTATESRLQEMSGMWLIVYPFFTAIMVVLGFFSLLIAAIFRTGRRDPKICPTCQYNVRGNTSGICPECGVALPSVEVRHIKPSLTVRMNAWCRQHATPLHPLLLTPVFFVFGCGIPEWHDWGGVFLICVFPAVLIVYVYLQAFAMRGAASVYVLLHLAAFVGASWVGAVMYGEKLGYEVIRLYFLWGLISAAIVLGALVATIADGRRSRPEGTLRS